MCTCMLFTKPKLVSRWGVRVVTRFKLKSSHSITNFATLPLLPHTNSGDQQVAINLLAPLCVAFARIYLLATCSTFVKGGMLTSLAHLSANSPLFSHNLNCKARKKVV